MNSDTLRSWFSSKLDENWTPQAYPPKNKNMESNLQNPTVVSLRYQHSNGSIQEYHEIRYIEEASTERGFSLDLSINLMHLLNDISSCDLTIKCGDEEMKVHQSILAAKSPVFKAMFNSSTRETSHYTVLIDDLEPQTFRDLIVFIYSNEIKNLSMSKACSLLFAAEKYQLFTLRDICCDFLKPILINVEFRKELSYVEKSTFIQQKVGTFSERSVEKCIFELYLLNR